ncbi:MAG: phenylalanine--tRNA ligase subunit beta [Odoribacteraceae bacterium]|jgi:phenylalanyl-tRNA synthetase beta chain|nr:phenylalanine--tRNA ligase subunit beta [Odoribacteraceae bacterium]
MNISLNWLRDYIRVERDVDEICRVLTNLGLEVAGRREYESIRGGLNGLVIGEVLTRAPHPNSDHLSVTTVDVGGEEEALQIVCGAPNVAAGQKVVVATIGTTLYDGDTPVQIKRSKIRGIESLGMICSESEIGVGDGHDGILVLPPDVVPGMKFNQYFPVYRDTVIEVDITPNRVDGASHAGVARDLAAFFGQTEPVHYALPPVDEFRSPGLPCIPVRLERPEACRRYAGICLDGLTVKPSPDWLQHRLRAVGLHPINNIVDVTNYILLGLGQPLHAFDRAKIKGDEIVVKSVDKGTRFVTLDGVERELHENDLLICNGLEPMCIAGIFGGLESGISADTTSVFLESACFDPVFIRKTARRLGLSTDASFRYERGTDPNIVIHALKVAAAMILEVAGGRISSDVADLYPVPVADFEVLVRYDHVDRLVGNKIPRETIHRVLRSLEITVEERGEEEMIARVPPYRVDVRREADVIEEFLRVYGFNNVTLPGKLNAALNISEKPDDFKLKNMISDLLAANGFHEVINNSLTKAAYFEGIADFLPDGTVMLHNPLSSDLNAMRRSLLFGGLENIAHNINRKNGNLKLFEFGKAYAFLPDAAAGDPLNNYREEYRLALFITGDKTPASWNTPAGKTDFFHLKAYCELVLERFGLSIDALQVEDAAGDVFREGVRYSLDGNLLLTIGIVNKIPLERTDARQEVFHAEFSWETLVRAAAGKPATFVPAPRFPAVKRDLALLLDERVSFREVRDLAFATERALLKSVTLFDVYQGEKLGAEKKSYAVSFTLLDEERTLTDKQIDRVMEKLVNAYARVLGATIR